MTVAAPPYRTAALALLCGLVVLASGCTVQRADERSQAPGMSRSVTSSAAMATGKEAYAPHPFADR